MQNVKNSQFPEIKTENQVLRKLKISDNSDIFAIRSDKGIAEYLDRPHCKSIEEAGQFINRINEGIEKNECFYWGVTDKINSAFMGTICLWNFTADRSVAEIGFEILPYYQGKGIMSEALSAIIEFGFNQIGLEFIEGTVHRNNTRSIKLLQKNNFKLKPGTPSEEDSEMITYRLAKT